VHRTVHFPYVDLEREHDELLAAAVEADLVEHVARLHEPPMGQVGSEAGSVWFLTGKDDPNENGVLRAEPAQSRKRAGTPDANQRERNSR
jgi:hypothetical protein